MTRKRTDRECKLDRRRIASGSLRLDLRFAPSQANATLSMVGRSSQPDAPSRVAPAGNNCRSPTKSVTANLLLYASTVLGSEPACCSTELNVQFR